MRSIRFDGTPAAHGTRATPTRIARAAIGAAWLSIAAAAAGADDGASRRAGGPADTAVRASSPATAHAAAEPASHAAADEAIVVVFNRPVATLRVAVFGTSPADRASRARAAVADALAAGGPGRVSVEPSALGSVLKVDGRYVFLLVAGDADRHRGETLEDATAGIAERLQAAIDATREHRDLTSLARSIGVVVLATAVAGGLGFALRALFRAGGRRLLRAAGTGAERLTVSGTALLPRERLIAWTRTAWATLHWAVLLLIVYEWLGAVLGAFAYTRPWSAQLNRFLLDVLAVIAGGVASALPDLLVATTIFALAAIGARLVGAFLDAAARSPDAPGWLDRDTVGPARRIAVAVVWLFALAMAYPYLPGSHTEAFRGLSVLVGLMISLGGSSLVGQAASGMVLMYTRTLRVGEYVSIDGNEGTVVALGTFTTRIRTGRGEELTLPNALVMGTVTRNHSRPAGGRGYMLDTEVTIGYDTPWRQVHAMLVEAARRTPGVVAEPLPRVFQTGLSDFYPRYRLVCRAVPTAPVPRAETMSALHANIQDVFNENGVQIMSPHYLDDPAEAKIVPPSRRDPPLATGATAPASGPTAPPPAAPSSPVAAPPVAAPPVVGPLAPPSP